MLQIQLPAKKIRVRLLIVFDLKEVWSDFSIWKISSPNSVTLVLPSLNTRKQSFAEKNL